ncbi:unnamed protein product [Cyprideis torosa]|uniref:Uncharacterized protein n=1 Tax=Cyprideis torosa TaxID=163714 RepID=A0A7R8W8M2_9CRUS|nr:unnamed protein product [Cyprideis torosa]CAG0883985.1 unnamed protein product [Cyprideis torosa]
MRRVLWPFGKRGPSEDPEEGGDTSTSNPGEAGQDSPVVLVKKKKKKKKTQDKNQVEAEETAGGRERTARTAEKAVETTFVESGSYNVITRDYEQEDLSSLSDIEIAVSPGGGKSAL